MKKQNKHIEEEIIVRYLANETSEEEKTQVESWINENDDNKKYFEELKNLFANSVAIKDFEQIDINEDLKKVKQSLSFQKSNKKLNSYKLLRIAAAIVVFVALGSVLTNYYTSQINITTIANNTNNIKYVTLPDGSKITLNNNAIITFNNRFNKNKREINFDGEAFFEIAKNKEKPFVIKSENSTTEILGTSFNLSTTLENKTEIVVVTGKVSFSSSSKNKIILEPGDKGIINDDKSIEKIENYDHNFLSWKTGIITFSNTSFYDVIETLSNHFNVNIKAEDSAFVNCKLTSEFENYSINEILEELEILFNLEIEIKDEMIILTGEECEI